MTTTVSLIMVSDAARAAPVLRAVTELGCTVSMPLRHVPFAKTFFERGLVGLHRFVYRSAGAATATDLPLHLNVEPKEKFEPKVRTQGQQLRDGVMDPVWFACAAAAVSIAVEHSPGRPHAMYNLLRVAPRDLGERRDEHTRRVNDSLIPLLDLVPIVTSAVYCRSHAHDPTEDLAYRLSEAVRCGVRARWCLQLWGVIAEPSQSVPITTDQAAAYARFIRASGLAHLHVYAECQTPAQAEAEAEGIRRIARALKGANP